MLALLFGTTFCVSLADFTELLLARFFLKERIGGQPTTGAGAVLFILFYFFKVSSVYNNNNNPPPTLNYSRKQKFKQQLRQGIKNHLYILVYLDYHDSNFEIKLISHVLLKVLTKIIMR